MHAGPVVGPVRTRAFAKAPGAMRLRATPTSFSSLPGNGRSRKLSGASGTKVWVRFARVFRNQQSAWSAPVLVAFP